MPKDKFHGIIIYMYIINVKMSITNDYISNVIVKSASFRAVQPSLFQCISFRAHKYSCLRWHLGHQIASRMLHSRRNSTSSRA